MNPTIKTDRPATQLNFTKLLTAEPLDMDPLQFNETLWAES